MASITHIRQLQALGAYLPDGVSAALEPLLRFMTPQQQAADSATLYSTTLAHTITVVDSSTGAYPALLLAKSNGTACTVKVYADDTATVGTTDAIVSLGVSGTSGEFSWCVFGGNGLYRLASTSGSGIGAAAPATDVGTGTVASDPDIWIIYFDA